MASSVFHFILMV